MSLAEETYHAVHAVSRGKLELTRKPLVAPPPGHVRVRVQACGVCHSDAATVAGLDPIAWPRVPRHKAIGVIDMLSAGVEGWAIGQRVGVGFLGGVAAAAINAGLVISSTAAIRSLPGYSTMAATPRC